MTYYSFGADWTAVAEQAIKTGVDIYQAYTLTKSVQEAATDETEKQRAQYYLLRLGAMLKEQEAAGVKTSEEKMSNLTKSLATVGVALLAALTFFK